MEKENLEPNPADKNPENEAETVEKDAPKKSARVRRVGSAWDDASLVKLITFFEQRPALWDITLTKYKDRGYRSQQMKDAAELLGKETEEINAQWNNLRGQFRVSRYFFSSFVKYLLIYFVFSSARMHQTANNEKWTRGGEREIGLRILSTNVVLESCLNSRRPSRVVSCEYTFISEFHDLKMSYCHGTSP